MKREERAAQLWSLLVEERQGTRGEAEAPRQNQPAAPDRGGAGSPSDVVRDRARIFSPSGLRSYNMNIRCSLLGSDRPPFPEPGQK